MDPQISIHHWVSSDWNKNITFDSKVWEVPKGWKFFYNNHEELMKIKENN